MFVETPLVAAHAFARRARVISDPQSNACFPHAHATVHTRVDDPHCPRSRGLPFTRHRRSTNKPPLGSRVDDSLSTIPQKGPSLDAGSAKMVGFYGVLAVAVGLALSYQG